MGHGPGSDDETGDGLEEDVDIMDVDSTSNLSLEEGSAGEVDKFKPAPGLIILFLLVSCNFISVRPL